MFLLQWQTAGAAAIVFDIGSRDSFTNVSKWWRRVQEAVSTTILTSTSSRRSDRGPIIPGVLIGTKGDFRNENDASIARDEVTVEEAQALASQLGLIGYYEVSTLTSTNIEEPFKALAKQWEKVRRNPIV